jgi:hypothetical protein
MHGGARPGAGRRPGTLNKRHQVTAEQIGSDSYTPIEYMLALMRDEKAEPTRRDQMAIQAAPFIHARLAVANVTTNGSRDNNSDINILQIYAVPRGARLNTSDGVVTIEGKVVEPSCVAPFDPTPPLELVDNSPSPSESPCLLSRWSRRKT